MSGKAMTVCPDRPENRRWNKLAAIRQFIVAFRGKQK